MVDKPSSGNLSSSYLSILSLTLIAFLLLAGIFFLIWPKQQKRQNKLVEVSQKEDKPKPQANLFKSRPKEASSLPPEKMDQVAIRGLGATLKDAKLPEPEKRANIPKDLHLGEQVITLKGGEWHLRLNLTLSSEEEGFSRYAGPLRSRLIQMTYFLVSHRVPEAMRSINAEERLRNDLLSRFRNVLRNHEFEIYFDAFSLEEVPLDEE